MHWLNKSLIAADSLFLSSRCKFMATEDALSCTNQFCPGKGQTFSPTTGFDLLLDFSDHTGTLHSCTLRSPEAEKTLGCTVRRITQLSNPRKESPVCQDG